MPIFAINNYPGSNSDENPSGPEFAQNNQALWLSFGFALDTGAEIFPNDIRMLLNGMDAPIEITEIQTPVRLTFFRTVAGIMYQYIYEFTQGKGRYGASGEDVEEPGIPVQSQWLKLLAYAPTSLSDIENGPNTVYINLGPIANQEAFITGANSAERDLHIATNQYFFLYKVGAVSYSKRFLIEVEGNPGYYGGAYVDQLELGMFADGPTSETPSVVIPNLNQITLQGNQSNQPLVVLNVAAGKYIQIDGDRVIFKGANLKAIFASFPEVPADVVTQLLFAYQYKNRWVSKRVEEDTTALIVPELIGAEELLQIGGKNMVYNDFSGFPAYNLNTVTGKITGFPFSAGFTYNFNYKLP